MSVRRGRHRRPGPARELPAAPSGAVVDLTAALAASHPADDVQCPSCGEISAHSPTDGAGPSTEPYSCGSCGRRWKVAPGAPWPDVIVDSTVGRVREG